MANDRSPSHALDYARSVLGNLPAHWRYARVGDLEKEGIIEDVQDGNHGERHPKSPDYVATGVPFIMAKDIINNRLNLTSCSFISREQADSLRIGFARPGDVLLTHKATMGRVAIIPEGYDYVMLTPQVTYYRIKDKKQLDARYLKYAFVSPRFQHQLNASSDQSTRKFIGITAQRDLWFPLPSTLEQERIANILGTLDDKIELNRRMNETLEAMARRLFRSWFVDFDPVHAKAALRREHPKLSNADVSRRALPNMAPELAELFPDSFEDSTLGPIPQGWHVSGLGDVVEILDSRRIPLSGRERKERQGRYPYHGAAGVMDHVDDFLFEGVHVLMGEDGSVVNDDGSPVLQYVWGKFWVNNHAHVLKGTAGVSSEHIYLHLQASNIAAFVTGAVQPKLNQGNLKRIEFLRPSLELNHAFEATVAPWFSRMRANADEMNQLTRTRDKLLPRLLSGELSVGLGEIA